MTVQTLLLPTDNIAAYEAPVARLQEEFEPATDEERTLVQALADTYRTMSRKEYETAFARFICSADGIVTSSES